MPLAFADPAFWQARVRWLPHYAARFVADPVRECQRIRAYSSRSSRDAFLSFQAQYVSSLLPAVRNLRPIGANAGSAGKVGFGMSARRTGPPGRALIRDLLTMYGSDKASVHDYDVIYEKLSEMQGVPATVVEIGLGTSNNLPSSMGPNGQPGASARAFRDWGSYVVGCDIDKKTLFNEPGILTLQLDQLAPRTFRRLDKVLDAIGHLDLVVIDGLHTPEADLNSLLLLAPRLSPAGLLVVEDVENDPRVLHMWQEVLMVLPDRFCALLVSTKAAHVVLLGLSSFWTTESLANLYWPKRQA